MRKILLLLFLSTSIITYAKDLTATLYLKNGSTKTGSVKYPEPADTTISFKSDKKEKISADQISKIVFTDKKGNNIELERFYTSRPKVFKTSEFVKSKNKEWVEIIYNKSQKIGVQTITNTSQNGNSVSRDTFTYYYYGNNNSDELVMGNFLPNGMSIAIGKNKSVYNMASIVFLNCPSILSKINETEFKHKTTTDQLIEIFDTTECN